MTPLEQAVALWAALGQQGIIVSIACGRTEWSYQVRSPGGEIVHFVAPDFLAAIALAVLEARAHNWLPDSVVLDHEETFLSHGRYGGHMSDPAIYQTLCANRAKYPTPMSNDQIAALLNETAWAYRQQLWGCLKKPDGSNCAQPGTGVKMSKDILALPTGQIVDCLIDAEGAGTPTWDTDKDPVEPDRWLAPVDPGGSTAGVPLPGAPPYNESYSVEFGNACNEVYAEAGVPIDAGMISVQSQRCAYDYYVGGLSWEASRDKHIAELRAVYGLP